MKNLEKALKERHRTNTKYGSLLKSISSNLKRDTESFSKGNMFEMYILSFYQRTIHFAGKLRSDWQGRLWDGSETFEVDPNQTELWFTTKLTRKKNHVVPNLDIIERGSILIAFLLVRTFSCFSVNTSLTFILCHLIRAQLYKEFCTVRMESMAFTTHSTICIKQYLARIPSMSLTPFQVLEI